MPLSRGVARFNVRVTNKVTRPFAGRLPGFGVVRHVGRRSGKAYETPVNLFRDGDRYVVALTYGAGSEWVKNVLAAGGCEVRTRGSTVEVTDPVVFRDPERKAVSAPARWALGGLDVTEFLSLTPRG
jgi:deazaflavin-dependent oxidoreductase (nitroreductase family)